MTVTVNDGVPVLRCRQHPGWRPHIHGDTPATAQAKADYHDTNPTHYLPDPQEARP